MERKIEELIERFLEGELSPTEEANLASLLQKGEHREDLRTHGEVVRILKEMERLCPSPSFTSEVMARLPQRKAVAERLWELLWAPRTLQWNFASALILLIAVFSVLFVGLRGPEAPPSSGQVAWVRFVLHAPTARQVALAGDFNGWRTDAVLLADLNGDGIYSVMVPLSPGLYRYMFVVDGERWVTDPAAEAYRDDGFGHRNAVIRVDDPPQSDGRRHGYGAV